MLPDPKAKRPRQKLFSPLESQILLTMIGLFLIVAAILIAKQH